MRIAITGATSGIGAEVAAKLRAGGHHITCFDLHEPAANVDIWIETDLSDAASIANAAGQAQGPFDALINNAGLPPRAGLGETILRVNYFGLVAMMDALLAKLSEGASVVNTASRAGAQWGENIAQVKALLACDAADLPAFMADEQIDDTRAYNLSKEAVIVMTKARTQEMLERGFRMNSVSPAAVSTGILDDFAAAFGDKMVKNLALSGRPGLPEEIADVIVYLTTPQSAWIKGQDIVIDGGMSAIAQARALGLIPVG